MLLPLLETGVHAWHNSGLQLCPVVMINEMVALKDYLCQVRKKRWLNSLPLQKNSLHNPSVSWKK